MELLEVDNTILLLHSSELNQIKWNKLYKVIESSSGRSDAYVTIRCIDDGTGNPLANNGTTGSTWSINPRNSEYILVGSKQQVIDVIDKRKAKLSKEQEELDLIKDIAVEGITEGISSEEYLYNYMEVLKEKGKSKDEVLKVMKIVSSNNLFKALSMSCKA